VAKPKVINLLDRFNLHRKAILRFLIDPSVPLTNNQAEQGIRMVKVKQKISSTFRSIQGARMFCRIRSWHPRASVSGQVIADDYPKNIPCRSDEDRIQFFLLG